MERCVVFVEAEEPVVVEAVGECCVVFVFVVEETVFVEAEETVVVEAEETVVVEAEETVVVEAVEKRCIVFVDLHLRFLWVLILSSYPEAEAP